MDDDLEEDLLCLNKATQYFTNIPNLITKKRTGINCSCIGYQCKLIDLINALTPLSAHLYSNSLGNNHHNRCVDYERVRKMLDDQLKVLEKYGGLTIADQTITLG